MNTTDLRLKLKFKKDGTLSYSSTRNLLDSFYIEIQSWIDAGCPKTHAIFCNYGICANLNCWLRVKYPKLSGQPKILCRDQLMYDFEKASLNELVPFNRSIDNLDLPEYSQEVMEDTIFKNPHRLAWIKKHATAAKRKEIFRKFFSA